MSSGSASTGAMYIDGQWVPSSDGQLIELTNPATEETIGTVPAAAPSDVDRALEAAERGWKVWRETGAWERTAVMRRAAELLRSRCTSIARTLTEEQGKPISEAEWEVRASADQFDWFADEARRIYGRTIDGHNRQTRLFVMKEPIGPVAAFSAWNFPALLPARKLAPAIAAGCSVVLKPAREAPRSAFALAEACHDAGLPAGVVNILTGESAAISSRLIASDVIRKVSLTGSIPVGQELLRLCAENVKPASMELGGHAPALVFRDADLDSAVEACVLGKFRNAGQVCSSASRFYVDEPIFEQFVGRFVDRVRRLKVGPGLDPTTEVGPMANERRLENIEALVQDAMDRGADLRLGGHRSPHFSRGLYFEPTVLTDVENTMELMRVEPFGPVAPITVMSGLEDGLEKANATPYGLTGYVFTRDLRTAFLAAEGLEVGLVGVNNVVIATAEAPFGGVKQSGFGRESGAEGIEDYTVSKYVNMLL